MQGSFEQYIEDYINLNFDSFKNWYIKAIKTFIKLEPILTKNNDVNIKTVSKRL